MPPCGGYVVAIPLQKSFLAMVYDNVRVCVNSMVPQIVKECDVFLMTILIV